MIRALHALVFLALWVGVSGQGLLRSVLLNQTDSNVVCTLSVRNFDNWNNPTYHYFRQSTATYLRPGDYEVIYMSDTTYYHAEWIHITTKWMTLYKYILTEHIPLDRVRFVRPKRKEDWEDGVIYLEF